MSPLLTLPYELRSTIYALVLTTPVELPDVSLDKLSTWVTKPRPSYCGAMRVDTTPFAKSTPSILLCNKQVNTEVKETIQWLIETNRLMYHLGCEVVAEHSLYPLWLSIPCSAVHIPHVHATFRQSGALKYLRSGWRRGDGGPGPMIWKFYDLLEQFLQRGPDLGSEKILNSPLSIGTLTVDIVTPKVLGDGEEFLRIDEKPCLLSVRRKWGDIGVVPALPLANELGMYFGYLTTTGFFEEIQPGESANVRVKKLVLCVDGVEHKVLHIQEEISRRSIV